MDAPRQSQTGSRDDNFSARGSSSALLEVPKEKRTGLKKWKSLTRMLDLGKKSSPPLRQTSLAINVCPDLQSSVILPDPQLYSVLYSPQIISGISYRLVAFALFI